MIINRISVFIHFGIHLNEHFVMWLLPMRSELHFKEDYLKWPNRMIYSRLAHLEKYCESTVKQIPLLNAWE